ncbi:C-type lectin domain-containing protein [Trichostrongylus colubriformis]|uniref:C-type lectin domain-containing protein n=1 Tax=Trichostrongylus colubriformis TaxID=6319 RepID=A0AAN8IN13_TRICO
MLFRALLISLLIASVFAKPANKCRCEQRQRDSTNSSTSTTTEASTTTESFDSEEGSGCCCEDEESTSTTTTTTESPAADEYDCEDEESSSTTTTTESTASQGSDCCCENEESTSTTTTSTTTTTERAPARDQKSCCCCGRKEVMADPTTTTTTTTTTEAPRRERSTCCCGGCGWRKAQPVQPMVPQQPMQQTGYEQPMPQAGPQQPMPMEPEQPMYMEPQQPMPMEPEQPMPMEPEPVPVGYQGQGNRFGYGAPEELCPDRFKQIDDACFHIVSEKLSYDQAERRCEQLGATMFSPTSIGQWREVISRTPKYYWTWTGIQKESEMDEPRFQGETAMHAEEVNWLIRPFSALSNGWSTVSTCAAHYNLDIASSNYVYFYPCSVQYHAICQINLNRGPQAPQQQAQPNPYRRRQSKLRKVYKLRKYRRN